MLYNEFNNNSLQYSLADKDAAADKELGMVLARETAFAVL